MRIIILVLAMVSAMSGCRGLGARDEGAIELERNFQDSDRQVREAKTRSSLVEMEAALAGYVEHERRIPDSLDSLIPKYLAEIPTVDPAVPGHRETSAIKYYRSSVLRAGQLDGTQLKDTGKWGYVHNDRQAVIFVDCAHPSSRGKPWYQEKGSQ